MNWRVTTLEVDHCFRTKFKSCLLRSQTSKYNYNCVVFLLVILILAGWFPEITQDDMIVFTMFFMSDTVQVRSITN